MRFLVLTGLIIMSGCANRVPTFKITAKDQPVWLETATLMAIDFWADHNVDFVYDDGAPTVIVAEHLPPDRIGEYDGWAAADVGTIRIEPDLALLNTGGHQDDVFRSCVVSHELGHSISMNHVLKDQNLMFSIISYPGTNDFPRATCAWGRLDQKELCRVQPDACD